MIIRRETSTGSNDLHVVYRPCKVDELIGNATNKKIIKNALDSNRVPHTQLFTGDAGCGKTTAAKIIALGLNCETNGISSDPCLTCKSCKSIIEGSNVDVREINVGQTGGKDYVDAIVKDLPMAPFNSRYKVIIFDEAHELTTAAKELLKKPIESGFNHIYYIFCTNEPEKLKSKNKKGGEPFLGGCSVLNFSRISNQQLYDLMKNVCEFEGFQFNPEVLIIITEEAKGVSRNALMWLNQIAIEGTWSVSVAKEICGLGSDMDDPIFLDLCRALNKGIFKESISTFEKMKSMQMETLRINVSSYFVSCLKRSKTPITATKYSKVLDILEPPIYLQGKPAEYIWYNRMFKITDVIARS